MSVAAEKKRVVWVDILKYVCMFFVFVSHVDITPPPLLAFLSPFFLTAFFFVSGYTHNTKKSFGRMLVDKLKGILLPWAIYSFFCSVLLNCYLWGWPNFWLYLGRMFMQIRGQDDTLWFLACLFVSYIPFYFVAKYLNKWHGLAVSLACAVISIVSVRAFGNIVPWHVQSAGVVMFFLQSGLCFKDVEPFFDKCFYSKKWPVAVALLVYIGIVIFDLDLAIININAYGRSMVEWFTVTVFSVMVAVGVAKLIPSNRFMLYIGRNTLLCFAFLAILFVSFNGLVADLGIAERLSYNTALLTLVSLTVAFLETAVMVPFAWVINRFLPFTLGKGYAKKKKAE